MKERHRPITNMVLQGTTDEYKSVIAEAGGPEGEEVITMETPDIAADHKENTPKADVRLRHKKNLFKAKEELEKIRKLITSMEEFRNWLMIGVTVVIMTLAAISAYLYFNGHRTAAFILAVISLMLFLLAVALFFLIKAMQSDETVTLVTAEMKKKMFENEVDNDDPSVAFLKNLDSITLNNQEKYYKLVHTHADKSFWATLAVSIGGFLLIGVGVYYGSRDTRTAAYIGAICGSISEFIAGVFFWLYSQTIRELRKYHRSLVSLQNTLLCLQLVQQAEKTNQPELLNKVVTSLLAGFAAEEIELSEQPAKDSNVLKRALDLKIHAPSLT